MKTKYVPRVNQLDSLQLDDEIDVIFKQQLSKSIPKELTPHLAKFQPEIDALLKSVLWKISVFDTKSTFGQQLLSITYDNDEITKYKLVGHYTLTIVLQYLRDNATFRFTNSLFIQKLITCAENVISILFVVNFFRFLGTGKWPSIVDYALGLDHVTLYGNRRRNVGYAHMTRELIWGGFMELLGCTVPLINYRTLSRKLKNAWSFRGKEVINQAIVNFVELTIDTKCAYCQERPTLPHQMGCSHVFCYYCLKGNLIADSEFQCPDCNFTNVECKPVQIQR